MKKCSSIEDVRTEIDSIDEQMIALLAQREQWVLQAAQFKKDADAVKAPERVEQVIAKVRAKAVELNANPEIVEVVYRTMIDAFIGQELLAHQRITQ